MSVPSKEGFLTELPGMAAQVGKLRSPACVGSGVGGWLDHWAPRIILYNPESGLFVEGGKRSG